MRDNFISVVRPSLDFARPATRPFLMSSAVVPPTMGGNTSFDSAKVP
jgi:hypothetical protein